MTVALDEPWGLSPLVAIRREPFGAFAYHFGNRRLTFLKQKDLGAVVEGLDASETVRAALMSAQVPLESWGTYLRALELLAGADMIRPHLGPEESDDVN